MFDYKRKPHFLTGSILVDHVEPNDIDIVVLIKDPVLFAKLQQENPNSGGPGEYPEMTVSIKEGDYNFICTDNIEFFYKFKAFSGALSFLQLKDREERVELAHSCLYWECPDIDL